MFLKIDEWLIRWAQFSVLFLELRVNITRKALHEFLLFLFTGCILLNVIMTVTLFYLDINQIDLVITISYVAYLVFVFQAQRKFHFKMERETQEMQKAIRSRSVRRTITLIICSLFTAIDLYGLFVGVREVVVIVNFLSVGGTLACILSLEYVLCTSSVPLAERQRRAYNRARK